MSSELAMTRPADTAFDLLQAIAENLQDLIVRVECEAVANTLRALLTETLLQGDELGTALDALQHPGSEHRRKTRLRAMGNAILRQNGSDYSVNGRCMDLSLGGACLSLDRPLPTASRWNLDIRLLGASSPLRISGRVSWCRRQPDSTHYKVGFEFLSDD